MINIPIETVLEKLKEAGLSEVDIENKIKQKMDQLSGLISREGAAHIIANELGLKLVEKTSGRLKIKDVLTGMRNVEILGKVTNVFDVREFQRKDGNSSKVGSFIVGDETGTMRITCWGSQADNIPNIQKDNVVKIVSGYVKENQGRRELHLNDNSKIVINPPGEEIGDVSFQAREFERKKVSELTDNMMNVELMGTVVGVDALRYFEVCPKCGKRARVKREDFECDTHGVVSPDFSYVMNVILDDGTSSLRVVCFREMVEKFLGLDKAQMITLKDNPDLETRKQSILGNIIKVKGRVKRNQMFDRLEFNCQDADLKPDPYEEMDGLDKDLEAAKAAPQEAAKPETPASPENQNQEEVPSVDEI